jgi:voltage-gated potassium channel
MDRLRQIVEGHESRAAKSFDLCVQLLILLSLISFAVETLPNLSPQAQVVLRAVEVMTVAIFTLEYILRVIVATNRWRYVFSVFGIIDLLAILPFYLSAGLDLRSLRVIRVLRLVRVFKLLRFTAASDRFYRALMIAKEELLLCVFVALILLYFAAVGIYYFEHEAQPDKFRSIFDSLWWAIATLTTVGYGDIYPITAGGRLFTFFVLVAGLGIVAVPSGLVAAALVKAREPRDPGK